MCVTVGATSAHYGDAVAGRHRLTYEHRTPHGTRYPGCGVGARHCARRSYGSTVQNACHASRNARRPGQTAGVCFVSRSLRIATLSNMRRTLDGLRGAWYANGSGRTTTDAGGAGLPGVRRPGARSYPDVTTVDEDGGGTTAAGSLREAIRAVNQGNSFGGCDSGHHRISTDSECSIQ